MSTITQEERVQLLRVQLGFLRDAEMRVRNAGRDVPEDLEAAIVETTLALAKIATTPKRVRNEAACCGNCPYRAKHLFTSGQSVCGVDSKTMHAGVIIHADDWCGQHPDFWKES